jgi:hypothetical protein
MAGQFSHRSHRKHAETADDFAERLSRLIGYAEDEGGLDRETLLAVL